MFVYSSLFHVLSNISDDVELKMNNIHHLFILVNYKLLTVLFVGTVSLAEE